LPFRKCFGKKTKYLLGVDIGTDSVKVAWLSEHGDNQLRLERLDHQNLPSGTIVDGTVMDRETTVRAIEKLLYKRDMRRSSTATALPSSSVIVKRVVFPKLPENELKDCLRWEACRHFPPASGDIHGDYIRLDEVGHSAAPEFLLVAAQKDTIACFAGLLKQAGLKPLSVGVDALALHCLFLRNFKSDQSAVDAIIDVGASKTIVTIVQGRSFLFNRSLPIGGNRYRKSIESLLKQSFDETEGYLKYREMSPSLLSCIQPVLNMESQNLADQIEKTFSYVRNALSIPPIHNLYICGGGSLVPGLRESLRLALNTPVFPLDSLQGLRLRHISLTGEQLEFYRASSALAVGLALTMTG